MRILRVRTGFQADHSFSSYLFYVSNRYPIGELKQFRGTGVLFNNGTEHEYD